MVDIWNVWPSPKIRTIISARKFVQNVIVSDRLWFGYPRWSISKESPWVEIVTLFAPTVRYRYRTEYQSPENMIATESDCFGICFFVCYFRSPIWILSPNKSLHFYPKNENFSELYQHLKTNEQGRTQIVKSLFNSYSHRFYPLPHAFALQFVFFSLWSVSDCTLVTLQNRFEVPVWRDKVMDKIRESIFRNYFLPFPQSYTGNQLL